MDDPVNDPAADPAADPLRTIARELHALRPTDFVAARNARASAAVGEGDRALASRIRTLVKPPAAAWAVNALDSERPELVDRAVELGTRLRAATEERDGDAMRSLGRDRQALLGELARAAAELGDTFDVGLSPSALTEVQQTFQAAFGDEAAASAVRSGLLVRTLTTDGLGPVDLEGALAVEGADGPVTKAPTRSGTTRSGTIRSRHADPRAAATTAATSSTTAASTTTSSPTDSASASAPTSTSSAAARADARARERAELQARREQEADDARAEADEAAARLASLELELRDNTELHSRLTAEARDLKQELEAVHDDLEQTNLAAARLRRERSAAERTASAAEREATRLRKRLDAST